MAPFAGWEMPIQYASGALAEHRLVRSSAGLFDISHMGQVEVRGAGSQAYLDELLSNDIAGIAPGASRYALMCREDGGIIDDVFVYRLSSERFLVVVNAGNRHGDVAWMSEHRGAHHVDVVDLSDETAMLAVQGPRALEVAAVVCEEDPAEIPRFGVSEMLVADSPAAVGRTGYTGEDGVEIFVPVEYALTVWEALLTAGDQAGIEVQPVGLAARDSLRFEPGFALYGHEISLDVTPVEARLTWACSLEKAFFGRDAIAARKEEGAARKLVTIGMKSPGVPREGYRVLAEDGAAIGEVVTGMYAPTVDGYYANAYVKSGYSRTGTQLSVEIRGRNKPAEVVKRPLYRPSYRE